MVHHFDRVCAKIALFLNEKINALKYFRFVWFCLDIAKYSLLEICGKAKTQIFPFDFRGILGLMAKIMLYIFINMTIIGSVSKRYTKPNGGTKDDI